MKLVTSQQMQQCDREAITNYHTPSLLLMEHAAYSIFEYMQKHKLLKQTLILCGTGNNGGDGLALARQLFLWSEMSRVVVVLMGKIEHLSEDTKVYYELCQAIGVPIYTYQKDKIGQYIKEAEVIVDALFGTGISRPITGAYAEIIEKANQSKAYKISVDMPSGITSDTGKKLGIAFKADTTITFELAKYGQYLYPGIEYTGELHIAQIGIPNQIIAKLTDTGECIDSEYAKTLLPIRQMRSNKGTYGKVLVVGGQVGMSGAVSLTAMSCLKGGAGIVTAAVPRSIHDIMEQKVTEVMTIPLDDYNGAFAEKACEQLEDIVQKYDVLTIGPGIGRGGAIPKIVATLLNKDKPCIIDADGLYALKPHLNQIQKVQKKLIITPHPGEMAYLIDQTISYVLEHAVEIVKDFASRYGIVTVLKLERSLISTPEGKISINSTGNPGLAKGGSGDVLTGIIAAFVAQGLPLEQAAQLGVYIHGKTADYLAHKESIYTLLPSDLISQMHIVFKELLN